MQLANKVFVVTGGGNGIGREVVLGLLAKGARVAAVDLREDSLAQLATAAAAGDRLSTHALDISDWAAVSALPEAVVGAHGQVDGLFNVAGIIQRFVPILELDLADMAKVMDVNFWGVVHTVKAFLPLLIGRSQACIVNVSSMGAFAPVPGQSVYGASKAAVTLLTEGLYAELRATGVRVTIVFPGGVATDIAGNSGAMVPGMAAGREIKAPMKMTEPADAAAQILEGAVKGSFRVVIGNDAKMLDKLSRLAPQKATDLIADKMKSLLDN